MPPDSSSGLSFQPLHPTFGAECFGVDFSKPLPDQTIAQIRQGVAKYGVLVFRSTELDDARHEAFARQFGEPDTSAVRVKPGMTHRLAPHMELTDAGNVGKDGRPVPKDSFRHEVFPGNGLFHVDCSYNARRAGYSILHAHQIPPRGTDQGTAFADTRTAYLDLDESTKREIQDLVLCHSMLHSRQMAAPDSDLIHMLDPEDLPMSRHKLVQLHEPSNRMNLYMASHAHHVAGRTEAESQPLIERLLDHACQDKYVFTVEWHNNGDVVMWQYEDNTCVMHRACGGSFHGQYIRDMRRATVYDSSSSAYGLNTFWARIWERMRVAVTAVIYGKIRIIKLFWKLSQVEL